MGRPRRASHSRLRLSSNFGCPGRYRMLVPPTRRFAMTPLRKRMIDDLKLRNCSSRTIEAYVSWVKRFAQFHKCSPDLLGSEAVREYQLHLINSGVSWSTFNQAVCALKFLYRVTLKVEW